jgi:site-specific recombinase XerD
VNSLQACLDLFLAGQAGEVSESTRRWYRLRLEQFVAFAGGELSPCDVSASLLKAFRAHLLDRGVSPNSVHGYQRATRRFFAWMVEAHILDRNVARDVPLIRLPPQPPKAISDDDLMRFLNQLPREPVRDRAIILLLADTGCRVGGLCSLSVDSLDLENRCATVVEKGNRGRVIYFTELTASMLSLYLTVRPAVDTNALFLAEKGGQPLSSDGVRRMLERVGERAGVKGRMNPHAFRHAFARTFLRNGGNLAALGRILGHAPGSPVTAQYYAVWDVRELQEYHDRFSPIARIAKRG